MKNAWGSNHAKILEGIYPVIQELVHIQTNRKGIFPKIYRLLLNFSCSVKTIIDTR